MEALEQLENCVDSLLERVGVLKGENARLRTELEALARTQSALAQENRSLHERLTLGERARLEALRRVDELLRKLQEHDSAGQAL